jgi:hypothetical protein
LHGSRHLILLDPEIYVFDQVEEHLIMILIHLSPTWLRVMVKAVKVDLLLLIGDGDIQNAPSALVASALSLLAISI